MQATLPTRPKLHSPGAATWTRPTPKIYAASKLPGALEIGPKVELKDDGTYELKDPKMKGLNPIEKMKARRGDALKQLLIDGKFFEMAKTDFKTLDESGKEATEDIDSRLKWMGLFHRRKRAYGTFMMRLKLPNGVVTADQMRVFGDIIGQYGKEGPMQGCADITTRQNIQLRGIRLHDVPEIFDKLASVDLTTIQSGMDNVRNVVGSPLAGIDPMEVIDTRPYANRINDWITDTRKGNLEITNLPRKFNVAVVGSSDAFEHPHINDLAYLPANDSNGNLGFNVEVGGFFSATRCENAQPLDAWIPEEQLEDMTRAVLTTFRDLGFRGNRQKCRMMWLIDELGMEEFRNQVQQRMPGKKLDRAIPNNLLDPDLPRRSYFGPNKQKQNGLNWVGILVPVGRLQADDFKDLARICEEYGEGEVRLTVEENVVISGVSDEKLPKLLEEPLLKKFTPYPGQLSAGLVACTGAQFCGLAQVETKGNAQKLTEELEKRLDLPRHVRMHWTGCPNTCGQVQVADIGFLGTQVRVNKKPTEAVDIYLGGTVGLPQPGEECHLGTVYKKGVVISELPSEVEKILIDKFGATVKGSAQPSAKMFEGMA